MISPQLDGLPVGQLINEETRHAKSVMISFERRGRDDTFMMTIVARMGYIDSIALAKFI